MRPAGATYRLESEAHALEILAALAGKFTTGTSQPWTVRLHYLDTFDARVWRRGGRLAVVEDGAASVLEWERERGDRSMRGAVAGIPKFAGDLPAGPMRDELEALIDVRALLPLVEVRLACRRVPVVDRRGKTVVQVRAERGAVRDARVRRRRLDRVLRVLPVRGYEREYRRVVSWVEKTLGLPAVEPCTQIRALAAVGRFPTDGYRPGGYPLVAGTRCDAAMKSILRSLLEAMRLNEDGARRNLDTEFLHDFRVAGRRTRSALSQVPDLYPRRLLDRYRRAFSWLGELTGPVRDLDVEILRLDEHRARLSKKLRAGLGPWEISLRARHRVAHRRLVAALDSTRYRRFVESWGEYLAEPVPERTRLANALRPVEQVARERIQRAHRRVLKRGGSIDADSPPERLHRLRIDCKKLRYLLEFFASLRPEGSVASLISHLKKLQNNLGDFNDYAVEQAALTRFVEAMPADGDGDGQSGSTEREAVSHLAERLRALQVETRAAFHGRFEEFAGENVTAAFQAQWGQFSTSGIPDTGRGDGP